MSTVTHEQRQLAARLLAKALAYFDSGKYRESNTCRLQLNALLSDLFSDAIPTDDVIRLHPDKR